MTDECKTCADFPAPGNKEAQNAFVKERIEDGRYRCELVSDDGKSFDLVCNECGHAGQYSYGDEVFWESAF